MRVLVVTATKESEVNNARRHLGYDQLVLCAPQGKGAELAAALAPAQAHRVLELPDQDLLGCLDALENLLRDLKSQRAEVRVATDGGTGAMSAAAFLACLSNGVEAWFLFHKAVRLPVLAARPVGQRFAADEAAVLGALEGRMAYDKLAEVSRLALDDVKRVCYALRKGGALRADAHGAELTALGAYYQRGLQTPGS